MSRVFARLFSYPAETPRIGLVRPGREGATKQGLSFRTIDTWTEAALAHAFTGVDAVVHAASVVHHPGATEAEYARFNVDGTRALVQACQAHADGSCVGGCDDRIERERLRHP